MWVGKCRKSSPGLLSAAQDNPYWAKMGICVLDEFDKLAGAGSPLALGGQARLRMCPAMGFNAAC